MSLSIGVALVVLGVGVTLASAREHAQVLRRLRRGEPVEVPRWSLGLVLAMVLAGLGMAMVIYLFGVGR